MLLLDNDKQWKAKIVHAKYLTASDDENIYNSLIAIEDEVIGAINHEKYCSIIDQEKNIEHIISGYS